MAKNDDKIKAVLKTIESKREKLGTKPANNLKTNGVLIKEPGSHLNLNTINDIKTCVDTVAFILQKKNLIEESVKLLEIEYADYTFNGYSFEDWLCDFKLRASIITWNQEKKKLTALEKKLKDLRSEDAKTDDAISDIMAELG